MADALKFPGASYDDALATERDPSTYDGKPDPPRPARKPAEPRYYPWELSLEGRREKP